MGYFFLVYCTPEKKTLGCYHRSMACLWILKSNLHALNMHMYIINICVNILGYVKVCTRTQIHTGVN